MKIDEWMLSIQELAREHRRLHATKQQLYQVDYRCGSLVIWLDVFQVWQNNAGNIERGASGDLASSVAHAMRILTLPDRGVASTDLEQALACIRHIEAWSRGEVDLLPAGTWQA